MLFVANNDVIKAFTPDRANHPLDVAVLPRGAWRKGCVGNAHCLNLVTVALAVSFVTVANEISGRLLPREGFGNLLQPSKQSVLTLLVTGSVVFGLIKTRSS